MQSAPLEIRYRLQGLTEKCVIALIWSFLKLIVSNFLLVYLIVMTEPLSRPATKHDLLFSLSSCKVVIFKSTSISSNFVIYYCFALSSDLKMWK